MSDGPWRLHKVRKEGFWTYPMKHTRFLKRWVVDGSLLGGDYEIFEIHRTWYHTETREFETTVEVLKTFDDVLAGGRALFDPSTQEYITPEEV